LEKMVQIEKDRAERAERAEKAEKAEKEKLAEADQKVQQFSDLKVRHKDLYDMKKLQQDAVVANLVEKHKREAAELQERHNEKLELLGNDLAARRKEALGLFSREKEALKKQFEEEMAEIDLKYPRMPQDEQDVLTNKLEDLLKK